MKRDKTQIYPFTFHFDHMNLYGRKPRWPLCCAMNLTLRRFYQSTKITTHAVNFSDKSNLMKNKDGLDSNITLPISL